MEENSHVEQCNYYYYYYYYYEKKIMKKKKTNKKNGIISEEKVKVNQNKNAGTQFSFLNHSVLDKVTLLYCGRAEDCGRTNALPGQFIMQDILRKKKVAFLFLNFNQH